MSSAEHAFENAIFTIKQSYDKSVEEFGQAYRDWKNTDPNLDEIKAAPEEVWAMAMYAFCNMNFKED